MKYKCLSLLASSWACGSRTNGSSSRRLSLHLLSSRRPAIVSYLFVDSELFYVAWYSTHVLTIAAPWGPQILVGNDDINDDYLEKCNTVMNSWEETVYNLADTIRSNQALSNILSLSKSLVSKLWKFAIGKRKRIVLILS